MRYCVPFVFTLVMKRYILSLISFLFLQLSLNIDARELNLPTRTISSIEFYVYEVDSKDATIFGLAKELGVTEDEILRYNPDLSGKIKKSQKIFFPLADFVSSEKDDSLTNEDIHPVFKHKVKSGETLYGISKLYNVSQDSVISYNPNCIDGIKAGEELIIPQSSDVNSDNDNIVYHTIAKGNTLYNISNRYNTTIEEIIKLNPGVSPTNFKIGEVIKIAPNRKTTKKANHTNVKFINYTIIEDDSFENISNKFNVTPEDIKITNGIGKLPKKGKIISIPIFNNISKAERYELERAHGIEIYDSINNSNESEEIKISLLLPFMTNKKKQDSQSKLFCEFYKGFLIAVDSLRSTTDKRIKITALDTKNSTDTIQKLLSDSSIKNTDLIIGPNEKEQLNIVSNYSTENNINLVNPFIIKAEDYNNNDKFFHVNMPNTYMHTKLMSYYDELFQDWTPVFLDSKNNEPKDIALKIQEEIVNRGKYHKTISFDKALTYEILDSLLEANKKYVFIPLNSSRPMLMKIIPALKKLKNERVDLDFALFGYPEWTSYSYEYRKSFKDLNTYVYSRFFLDKENPEYTKFIENYDKWYGEDLINAIPAFGALGYDIGMYFVSNLINDNRLNKDLTINYGIQTPFNFKRISHWSGHVNWAICFIHYTNDKIERMVR